MQAKKIFTFFIITFFTSANCVNAQVVSGYNERVEQQELEIRRLTGEIETLKYKNQNLEIKLNGIRKEMELRFKELEASENTENSNVSNGTDDLDTKKKSKDDAVADILSPTQESKLGGATLLYDAAQSDLQRKNYKSAAQNFERIIKEYPEHNLTPNAYYWLGETYYGRKEYDKAALTFLEGKRKFPQSTKAGHSLLKLGLSLHYLKQDSDACLTFDEVQKHYIPKDKSLVDILRSSRAKVGCKS